MTAGKGDGWRKGTNFKNYWESDFWKKQKPRKKIKKEKHGRRNAKKKNDLHNRKPEE